MLPININDEVGNEVYRDAIILANSNKATALNIKKTAKTAHGCHRILPITNKIKTAPEAVRVRRFFKFIPLNRQ
jgi:hypothetical protein